MSNKKKISLVVTFYNEEESIDDFVNETVPILEGINNLDYEIIFVNDKSNDNSLKKLLEHRKINKKIKIINLARRFGPMESIMAGIKLSSGDALINIDVDLQDPPSLIPEIVKFWRDENYDVVFTTRTNRQGEGLFKKIVSSIGYRLLKMFTYIPIERDSGDFKLISRKVINEYKKFKEIYPFFRFIIDWIGFEKKQIFYERKPRRKGKTKHPLGLGVIFNFFEISLIPFTDAPIRFALLLGIISFIVVTIILLRTLFLYFSGAVDISSTSIFVAFLFFGSMQSLILGLLAIYISAIFKETKNRPLYIIDNTIGFEELDHDKTSS